MILLLLAGLCVQAIAQNKRQYPNPQLRWDSATYHYGVLELSNQVLRKELYFTNISDTALLIQSCYIPYRRAVAEFSKEPVQPGKRGKVVLLQPLSETGVFRTYINLHTTRGPQPPAIAEGEVRYPAPHYMVEVDTYNTAVPYGQTVTLRITFTNKDSIPLQVYFNSFAYADTDILRLKSSGNNEIGHEGDAVPKVVQEFTFINMVGNAGLVTRTLRFWVNGDRSKSVSVPVKLEYRGAPGEDTVIQSLGFGYSKFIYSEGVLQRIEYYDEHGKSTGYSQYKKGQFSFKSGDEYVPPALRY